MPPTPAYSTSEQRCEYHRNLVLEFNACGPQKSRDSHVESLQRQVREGRSHLDNWSYGYGCVEDGKVKGLGPAPLKGDVEGDVAM